MMNKNKQLKIPDAEQKFINISKQSDTTIGKKLSPGYGYVFDTLIGKVGNIRTAMEYIVTVGYPKRLLSKKRLTRTDILSVENRRKVELVNYWAIVVYLLAIRIQSDADLVAELKDTSDDTYLTSFTTFKNKSLGTEAVVNEINVRLSKYVSAVRLLVNLIQKDNFNDNSIKDLITSVKANRELPLFHGVPFNITSEL